MPTRVKSNDQAIAEREVGAFKQELGPFVVAAETTRMAMVFTNAKEADNPVVFANDSFLALTGYGREEVLGQAFRTLLVRNAPPEMLAQVRAAFDGKTESSADVCCRRKDGGAFWAAVFVSPVRDKQGRVVQHFTSFVDLDKLKQEQARSSMLIDELNHRVKNTLSTVQSIVSQALRGTGDPETIRRSIESRIFALSRSHDLLTEECWVAVGLHDLLETALEPFGVANGRAERFSIAGADIRLPPKAALALGIAFHELATNAVKYGAFSNDKGSITIGWTVQPTAEGDRLILRWEEANGPRVSKPKRRGFGSQVIERGLGHELEGTVALEFRPAGVLCTIDIPVPRGPPA